MATKPRVCLVQVDFVVAELVQKLVALDTATISELETHPGRCEAAAAAPDDGDLH